MYIAAIVRELVVAGYADLAELLLRPPSHVSYAAAGSLLVYGAVPYFSQTKHRDLSDECNSAQDLVQSIKDGKLSAIKEGAALLAKHPNLRGFKGIVTAAPRSAAGRPSNMRLAGALVKNGIGTIATELVVREKPVESSRMRRRRGLEGIGFDEHYDSMAFVGQPSDMPVLIVDDVFTKGNTLRAVAARIRAAKHTGPIQAATIGYFISKIGRAHV